MKQIQYAGYSILRDGTWKFRTATDQKRVHQLESFGELSTAMERDFFMSAEEAVAYGLADKVITSR